MQTYIKNMDIWKIKGMQAIRIAERDNVTLHKYPDPIEGYRKGISPELARSIVREDENLIYCP